MLNTIDIILFHITIFFIRRGQCFVTKCSSENVFETQMTIHLFIRHINYTIVYGIKPRHADKVSSYCGIKYVWKPGKDYYISLDLRNSCSGIDVAS